MGDGGGGRNQHQRVTCEWHCDLTWHSHTTLIICKKMKVTMKRRAKGPSKSRWRGYFKVAFFLCSTMPLRKKAVCSNTRSTSGQCGMPWQPNIWGSTQLQWLVRSVNLPHVSGLVPVANRRAVCHCQNNPGLWTYWRVWHFIHTFKA